MYRELMDHALPVLTKKQEQTLVRKAKAGCKRSKEKFIQHNLSLAMNVAKGSFRIPNYDLDDLFSIAVYGMLKAYDYFDPDRGYKFSTVAVRIIRQHLTREYWGYYIGHGVRTPFANSRTDFEKGKDRTHPYLSANLLSLDVTVSRVDNSDVTGADVIEDWPVLQEFEDLATILDIRQLLQLAESNKDEWFAEELTEILEASPYHEDCFA